MIISCSVVATRLRWWLLPLIQDVAVLSRTHVRKEGESFLVCHLWGEWRPTRFVEWGLAVASRS
jgi:hypothetical protein